MFTPFNRQKLCRHGTILYNFNDLFIGRALDLYGEWTEGEVELFRQVIYSGNFVVEVGANIGAHTLFFAQTVWPTGQVLAFEPQRLVFQTLCANLALNSIPNVDARNLALGNAPGALRVSNEGEPVPVVTLDSLNLPGCDFIKIDVGGMGTEILEGAAATIARCQPILYVQNERTDKSSQLIRTIDALGYKMVWHLPFLFQPNNFAGNPDNVFDKIASSKMICVPKTNLNYNLDPFQPVVVPPA